MLGILKLTSVLFVPVMVFNFAFMHEGIPGEPLTAKEMENVFAAAGGSHCYIETECSSPDPGQSCGDPDDGNGTCSDSGIITSGSPGTGGPATFALVCGSCTGPQQESCALSGCYFWCNACAGSAPFGFCCNKSTCRFKVEQGKGECQCFQNLITPSPHNSRETCL